MSTRKFVPTDVISADSHPEEELTNAPQTPSLETAAAMAAPGDPLPALLTLAMVRRHYLPLGERTVFRMISAGTFPPADVRIGGKVRLWRRETIEAWVDAQSQESRRKR
jgi:predicted DNA-binding transcriptional regulator AlpA